MSNTSAEKMSLAKTILKAHNECRLGKIDENPEEEKSKKLQDDKDLQRKVIHAISTANKDSIK